MLSETLPNLLILKNSLSGFTKAQYKKAQDNVIHTRNQR